MIVLFPRRYSWNKTHIFFCCQHILLFPRKLLWNGIRVYMQGQLLNNYVHKCLILTTMHVFGVVTLIFFLIVHQACWTRHFIWNPVGACDVAITSIRISVIAIGFSMTKIITLSNIFTCIRKCQFIKGMKMYSQTPLRDCLHGGGGPQVGEVTCGGSPHLSCKRD